MSLSIGDAVLTFLGDTTQLDQVFARIPIETETAMLKAAGSVGAAGTAAQQLSFELDATGENAAFAGGMISEAAEVSAHTIREAKAEAHLLGDMFGIHLPRHVRGFIVELPGVATALSAAFAATAVFFIIEALVKGIEKIREFAAEGEKIDKAWIEFGTAVQNSLNSLDEKLLKSGAAVDTLRGDHLAALKKELELINHQSMSELEGEFGLLAKAADAMFAQLKAHWFEVGSGSEGAQHALEQFRVQYDLLLAQGKKKEASDLLAGTLQSAKDTLDKLEKSKANAEELAKISAMMSNDKTGVIKLDVDEKGLKAQQTLVDALNAQATAERKINDLAADQTLIKRLNAEKKASDDLEKVEKEREAGIERRRKAEANYAKEQEKQHEKTIKDSEREKDELNAANLAVANVQLAQFHRMTEAALSWINGEMNAIEAATQRKAALFKFQFDTGIISGQQYLAAIKKLYNDEAQALINLLNQKQQLVILEAQKEAAARGQIMSVAEAKELKGFIDLENQKRAVIDKSLATIDKEVQKITVHAAKAKPTWDKFFDDIIKGSTKSGAALKTLGALTAQAIGESVAAAVMGSQSFGAAMMQMLKSVLAMLAGKAVVKALEELAEAFSALANPFTAWMAPGHFKAAAMWGVVAGAAGAAGAALGGGGSGASGGGDHPQIDKENPNTQTKGNPPPGDKNVPHLAGGGLITETTRAMIHSGEAVIPLTDSNVMDAIGAAITRHSEGARGGDTFYFQTKGLISADTWSKTAKKLSRQVKTGRARLVASDSHKTTRRA